MEEKLTRNPTEKEYWLLSIKTYPDILSTTSIINRVSVEEKFLEKSVSATWLFQTLSASTTAMLTNLYSQKLWCNT